MSPASACLLLANITPVSTEWQSGLFSVLAGLALILAILAHFRRKPPLDTELVKLHSAIESLKVSVRTLNETATRHAEHAPEIASLKEKVRTLEAAREADLAAQRKYTRETSHEIFAKLDELKNSVSQNFQRVERALGQLEGKVEGLAKD